jgi:hypothetical protein
MWGGGGWGGWDDASAGDLRVTGDSDAPGPLSLVHHVSGDPTLGQEKTWETHGI